MTAENNGQLDLEIAHDIPASRWCISYNQLLLVESEARKIFGAGTTTFNEQDFRRKTMRDICNAIIIPKCNETGKSYALSLNPTGLDIDVFVTHSWDGYFADFILSIRNTYQAKSKKPNFWICAFALLQSQDEAIIEQQVGTMDDSLEATPFVQALEAARSFCVVRNSTTDLYTRIWCVCELMYATNFGLFPDETFVTGPNLFAHMQTHCVNAQASRWQDKTRITRVLFTKFDREVIDRIVQEFRSHEAPLKILYYHEMAPPRSLKLCLTSPRTRAIVEGILVFILLGLIVAMGIKYGGIVFIVVMVLMCMYCGFCLGAHAGTEVRLKSLEKQSISQWNGHRRQPSEYLKGRLRGKENLSRAIFHKENTIEGFNFDRERTEVIVYRSSTTPQKGHASIASGYIMRSEPERRKGGHQL